MLPGARTYLTSNTTECSDLHISLQGVGRFIWRFCGFRTFLGQKKNGFFGETNAKLHRFRPFSDNFQDLGNFSRTFQENRQFLSFRRFWPSKNLLIQFLPPICSPFSYLKICPVSLKRRRTDDRQDRAAFRCSCRTVCTVHGTQVHGCTIDCHN